MITGIVKRAFPVFAGWLGTKFLIKTVVPKLPLVDKLGIFAGPVVSALAIPGYALAAKRVAILRKHQPEVMIGMGINLLEQLITSFAPSSVKSLIGMSDYVELGDYIQTGAAPIDDDIALSDYLTTGQVEQELGQLGDGLQQELGLEQELGIDEGVSTSQMLAPVSARSFVAPVPSRSFTQAVPRFGAGFDNAGSLYTGVFGGGF